jgi:F420-dependent oxidoreductase-like protein
LKVGLQISSFTWPGGPPKLPETLDRVARTADDAGFDSIWVMDHFFQIRSVGRPEEPMLEGFTTLGRLSAITQRARLGLMVGGVHYRNPGLWAKAATTLDVLSAGRGYFGIGAAWNEEESRALGFPFPPLGERYELLEDTLRVVRGMWEGPRGSEERYDGTRVNARRLLNSPQALSRPRPPILVGGGGERKTLRLVARYADACNVFGGPDRVRHKYAVLREHCDAEGRDYAEIERTNLSTVQVGDDRGRPGATPAELVDRFGALAEAGVQHAIFSVQRVFETERLELIGSDVIPHVRSLGEPSPIP